MKTINEHIKNNEYKGIYLITGSETYLRKQAKDKLHKALVASDDTMNYSYFDGKKVNPDEIMGLSQTLPFFSDHRLIIMEDSNLFKSTSDDFINNLAEIPDTTHMVFVEAEVDKRSKLYKKINQLGYVAVMDTLDERSLIRWIVSLLKSEQKNMDEVVIHFFLEKIGFDMDNIKNELEKLFSYTLNRPDITKEDVESVSTTLTTNKIFDMINGIANCQQKIALDLYYDLLALKEPPMRILFLITRQFNLLLQTKDLVRLNYNNKELAKKIGLAPFIVTKYINQAKHFSIDTLKTMLIQCANTEEQVKTGIIQDTIGVELLIIEFSKQKDR